MIKDNIRRIHVAYLRWRLKMKEAIKTGEQVLIVAPHPDDEVIGCGGLIGRLVAEGTAPHIVIMTGGEGSHRGCCGTAEREIVAARRGLTRKALAVLGVPETQVYELDFTDGRIDEDGKDMSRLRALIEELKPDTILVPHWGEGWSDHVKTAEIVKRIVPSTAEVWEYCVWMWYYNVWRGLDWKNAAALRLTREEQSLKLRAMDEYIKPLAPCGRPRSGELPKVFTEANSGNIELYFRCR